MSHAPASRRLSWLLAGALLSSVSRVSTAADCSIPVLEPSGSLAIPVGYAQVLAGDLNRDGLTDLVTLTATSFSVQLSLGQGRFASPKTYAKGGSAGILRDVDSDGVPDLLFMTASGIAVLLADGKGEFFEVPTLSATGVFSVGDVTGEGRPDVISRNEAGFRVFVGDGRGGFASPVETPEALPGQDLTISETAADMDGDGIGDVAGTAFWVYPSPGAGPTPVLSVKIYSGSTSGVLTANPGPISSSTSYGGLSGPARPVLADADGDGVLDLLLTGTESKTAKRTFFAFFGDGHGSFRRSSSLSLFSSSLSGCWTSLSVPLALDIDQDGRPELVLATEGECTGSAPPSLRIYRPTAFSGQNVLVPLSTIPLPSFARSFFRLQLDPGREPVLAGDTGSGLMLFGSRGTSCPPLAAPQFSYTPRAPVQGQKVTFTDQSTGDAAAWSWDFGDGLTDYKNTLQNPTHAFSKAGKYVVTLTVINSGGTASRSTTVDVGADPSFAAKFAMLPPNPVEGQTVAFVEQSTGIPSTWAWDFGDGGTASGRTPTHVYSKAGNYEVALTISDGALESRNSRVLTVLPRSARLALLGGRIGVAVTWRSQYTGETGVATPLPQSDQFGYFSFTSPRNPEVFVKALDFGPARPYLVFFAGLTDYEYTVTFTNLETGQALTFLKSAGSYSGGADNSTLVRSPSASALDSVFRVVEEPAAPGTAPFDWVPALRSEPLRGTGASLLLSGGNVRVEVRWRSQYTGTTGEAAAIPREDEFGYFYFSDPNNPEVYVKVLDFGATRPYLLFFGGLTDFEYTVTFTNVKTGQAVSFKKDAGSYTGGADNKTLLH